MAKIIKGRVSMKITSYLVEKLIDPTGILSGDRYEFILDIEVDEEDDLFSKNGIYVKLIFVIDGEITKIAQYQLYERVTDRYLDFALDEEELEQIVQFCQDHFVEKS